MSVDSVSIGRVERMCEAPLSAVMRRRWAQATAGSRARMTVTSTEIAGMSQPGGGGGVKGREEGTGGGAVKGRGGERGSEPAWVWGMRREGEMRRWWRQ